MLLAVTVFGMQLMPATCFVEKDERDQELDQIMSMHAAAQLEDPLFDEIEAAIAENRKAIAESKER